MKDHKPTEDYVNMLFSYSLFPIITKPTRITSHSATLIDHIYTNSAIFDLTAGILTHDITDHLPVFCLLANTSNDFTDKAVIYYRDFSKFKKENYLNDLRNTDWDALFHKDLNITAKNISDTIQSIINKYAPMKIASRRKVKLIRKPWLTRGTLKSIKHKQKLYHTLSKNPQNTEKLSQYKKYSNLLNNIIKNRKRAYLISQFESNKSNLRKTWKLIGHLIKRKSKSEMSPTMLVVNNKTFRDKQNIAHQFNNFFVSIGPDLANNIRNTGEDVTKFICNSPSSTFFLSPVTRAEVSKRLSSLDSKKKLHQTFHIAC